jgi:hypothetical protein
MTLTPDEEGRELEDYSFQDDHKEHREELLDENVIPLSSTIDELNDPNLDHYEHRNQTSFAFLSSIFLVLSELVFTTLCAIMWSTYEDLEEENVNSIKAIWILDFLFGIFGIITAAVGIASSLIVVRWKIQIKLAYAYMALLGVKSVLRIIVCIYATAVVPDLFYVFIMFAVLAIGLYTTIAFFSFRRARTIKDEMAAFK